MGPAVSRYFVFSALIAIWLLSSGAAAQGSELQAQHSLRDLLIEYRCPVVDRLERIFVAGDIANDEDCFLAITVPEHPHGYVQCLFHDRGSKILCEASSGFYYDRPGQARTFRLESAAVQALGRLGFSTDDSAGNFRIDLDAGSGPDLNRIADFILNALHDGYGARATTKLRFNAPLAPVAHSRCIPVS